MPPSARNLVLIRHLNWVATNMNVPRLRFQGFKGDWLESRINQITSYVDYRGKTPTKVESGVFLVTAKNVRMGHIDYENSKEFIAEDDYDNVMSRGKPVIGDVLITTEAPMGNIASVDRDDIALAQRVIKLRGIETILQNEFLKYRLQSKQFQEKLTALSSGGTVKGIKGSVLHKIQVLIPAIGEQQKIASFLSAIDQKISLLTKRHELLIQFKKGVMQKIFNQEIRFKDKNGNNFPDSKRVFLGDIAEFYKGKGISKSDISSDGLTPCIRYGELYTQYGVTISEVISKTNAPIKDLILSKANDVIIPASGETQIDIATASCVIHGGIALGGDLNIIRTEQSGVFLCYYLNSEKKLDIAKLAQGNSVVHLYASQLKGLEIELPALAEQELIAKFLSLIDKKIDLCNAELIATKQYKQGLLQQMFI